MKCGTRLAGICLFGAVALALCLSGIAVAQPALPPGKAPAIEGPTLLATLAADAEFSKFAELLKATGMEKALDTIPNATVFAPTDAAFAAMPKDEMEAIEKTPIRARALVLDHLSDMGALKAADLAGIKGVRTFNGKELIVVAKENAVETVGGAKIVKADIIAGNGVIHGIDKIAVATPLPEPAKPSPKPGTDAAK